jgi:hypothetical protein
MALSYLVWPKAKRKKANKNKIGEHKKRDKGGGKNTEKIGLVYLLGPTFVRQ